MRGKTKPRRRLSKRRLKPNGHVKNLPLRPPAKAGRQNPKPLPGKSVRRERKKRPSQQRALASVMRKRVTVIPLLLILSLSGCGWIRQNRVAESAADGRIDNNVYTSPRQTFRIRLPWLSSDSTLRDERPTTNTIHVTIEDNLCREFPFPSGLAFLGMDSLQSWVDMHIVEDLKRRGFKVESEALTTRNGTAIALRYRAPAAAPCSRTTGKDGKSVVTQTRCRRRLVCVSPRWRVLPPDLCRRHRPGRAEPLVYQSRARRCSAGPVRRGLRNS